VGKGWLQLEFEPASFFPEADILPLAAKIVRRSALEDRPRWKDSWRRASQRATRFEWMIPGVVAHQGSQPSAARTVSRAEGRGRASPWRLMGRTVVVPATVPVRAACALTTVDAADGKYIPSPYWIYCGPASYVNRATATQSSFAGSRVARIRRGLRRNQMEAVGRPIALRIEMAASTRPSAGRERGGRPW